MKAILILIPSHICFVLCSEWVDPHNMISGAKSKLHEKLKKSSSVNDLPSAHSVQPLDFNIYNIHFKRMINLLLNAAKIDKSDSSLYHGHIMFDITPVDLNYLLNLKNDDLTIDTLRRIDTIFSESFSKTLVETYLEDLLTLQSKLYTAIVNIHNLWLLGTCFMLYVVYQLFRTNFSFAYIVKYLIIIVFIVDFGLRYKVLLEEADEHNLNIQYSSLCDTTRMSWNDYFVFLTSNRDCERRTVTPLDAFLFQIKSLIIVPMHAVGTGMGGFVMNMYKTTPYGLGLIMLILMLIFSLVLFIFLMAFTTDKAIEFNCFHLFKLKFGTPGSRESMLSGRTVERLIDRVLHRPMVQDIGAGGDTGPMNCIEERRDAAGNSSNESRSSHCQKKTPVEIQENLSNMECGDSNVNQTENNSEKRNDVGIETSETDSLKTGYKSCKEDNATENKGNKTGQEKLDASTSTQIEGVFEDCSKGTQTQFIKYN